MKPILLKPSLQKGVVLIEAMIAIIIFTVGVLAMIGAQTNSFRAVSSSKMRTDAAFLADRLIGEMWVSSRNPATGQLDATSIATLQNNYGTGKPLFANWFADAQAVLPNLFATSAIAGDGTVTITIQWQAPSELDQQTYTTMTVIN